MCVVQCTLLVHNSVHTSHWFCFGWFALQNLLSACFEIVVARSFKSVHKSRDSFIRWNNRCYSLKIFNTIVIACRLSRQTWQLLMDGWTRHSVIIIHLVSTFIFVTGSETRHDTFIGLCIVTWLYHLQKYHLSSYHATCALLSARWLQLQDK